MTTLYGVPVSPYCRKVQLAFAFRGIQYEMAQTIPGANEPAFQAASPLGKIPAVLTAEGHQFADSSVIIAYFEKTVDGRPLYPSDAGQLARALFLEEYADTQLSEATTALYFERLIGPLALGKPTDEVRVQTLVNETLPAELSRLETLLPESGWAVENQYSVADVAIGTMLLNLTQIGEAIDPHKYPRVAAYLKAFSARPEVVAQLEQERQTVAYMEQMNKQPA